MLWNFKTLDAEPAQQQSVNGGSFCGLEDCPVENKLKFDLDQLLL